MSNARFPATLFALAMLATIVIPGAACAVPAGEGPEVVVTAIPKLTPQQVQGQAVPTFVQSHGAVARGGQLTRWTLGICPDTIGLPPSYDAYISNRIVAVAAKVGAPVDKAKPCTPNIEVIFTDNPQRLLDSLLKKQPASLGYHTAAQAERMAKVVRPIQAWYVTAIRGDSGQEAIDGDPGSMAPSLSGAMPHGRAGSLLGSRISSRFYRVLIVADSKQTADHTVGQIADYITILALSQAAPDQGCGDLPSILDLLVAGCRETEKPPTLTPGDMAYLTALYATDLETTLPQERDNISQMMRDSAKH